MQAGGLLERLKDSYTVSGRVVHGRRSVRWALWAGGLLLAAVWPLLLPNVYYHSVAVLACIYILLGLGMNVLMGNTGLVHAGYAAFWRIGAYVVAILAT